MSDAVRVRIVAFNYRRVPAIALAKQMIQEGKIGRVFHIVQPLVDKLGHNRLTVAGLLIASAGIFLFGFATTYSLAAVIVGILLFQAVGMEMARKTKQSR